jgi:hypothetical protein
MQVNFELKDPGPLYEFVAQFWFDGGVSEVGVEVDSEGGPSELLLESLGVDVSLAHLHLVDQFLALLDVDEEHPAALVGLDGLLFALPNQIFSWKTYFSSIDCCGSRWSCPFRY